MATKQRDLLRAMFDAAVDAALPDKVVPKHLPPPPKGRTIVLGAGKASAAMAKAVEDHWPGPLEGLVRARGGDAPDVEIRKGWADALQDRGARARAVPDGRLDARGS